MLPGLSAAPMLAGGGRPPAFRNLAALFNGGAVDGIMIDLTDLTTLFQDANGAAAVVNNGDPIGLALDQHKWGGKTFAEYRAAQPELVTNGTFDTDISGWSNQNATHGNIAWASGAIQYNSLTTTNSGFYQAITTVVGRWYELTVELVSRSNPGVGNAMRLLAGTTAFGTNNLTIAISDTPGVKRAFFQATATTTYISFYCQSGNGANSRWDNISLKEIDGHHARQTSSQRPTWASATSDAAFNGTSQFLITDFYYLSGDGFLSAYVNGIGNAGTDRSPAGINSSSRMWISQQISTGRPAMRVGGSAEIAGTSTMVNALATLLLDKNASAAQLFYNGVQEATTASPGSLPTSRELYIGAQNNSGTAATFAAGRLKRIIAGQIRVQDVMSAEDFHANLIAA